MFLFDWHCDTITDLYRAKNAASKEGSTTNLRHNDKDIALDRMAGIGWCQCFAIFMPDTYREETAIAYFEENLHYFQEQLAQNRDLIVQASTADEIEEIVSSGKFATLLTVEGGSVLAGDLARISYLQACGVRAMTLTWNGSNEIASGNRTPCGFTPFGKQAVAEMERCGIIVDVSHLNDRSFWELTEFARRPLIATHSNARAVCDHPRNLTDAQIAWIVKTKGLIGLNYCREFISKTPDPTFEEVCAHISHFLALGAEEHLALGSDYDGASIPSWLSPAEKSIDFYAEICTRFGEDFAKKLFWENAMGFLRRYEREL